jgi:hypothetical protein
MEWILTGIAVPIVLGVISAYGATWYSNKQSSEREERAADGRAKDAVRAYIRSLDDYADYLEARQMSGQLDGYVYDATKELISVGSQKAIRTAHAAAAPYFHRLIVEDADKNPLRNALPDDGTHPMAGAENYAVRAKEVQKVLDRGLKKE